MAAQTLWFFQGNEYILGPSLCIFNLQATSYLQGCCDLFHLPLQTCPHI
jgi:hypothetical protein